MKQVTSPSPMPLPRTKSSNTAVNSYSPGPRVGTAIV